MREVGTADTQTQLDVFQEILGDSVQNKDETITSTSTINIKKLMSEDCAVQKKCNYLFVDFKKYIFKNT